MQKHPQHEALVREKGDRLKRGKSWMGRAEDAVRQICHLTNVNHLNFVACEIVALCFAFIFRTHLTVEKVGTNARHVVEILVGVLLTIFCFSYQIWHLLAQSLVSYVFMALSGKRFSHTLVFVFSMLYLSVCHICRLIYDYGGYTLDITGPLMIQTQKLTSLAFSLHDGRFKDWTLLTQDQKEHAVKKLPNLLQYMSFMFYFHGIMVGPFTFYNDYIAFIDGTYVLNYDSSNSGPSRRHPADKLNTVVLKKLVMASLCCAGMIILPGMFFPPEKLNTSEFYSMNFLDRVIFLLGVMTLARYKYYSAWILADAVNNAAGLGFSGYDAQGNPNWDLTNNIDIFGVEFSTSLKTNIDSWNKTTLQWLRYVIYDRIPFYKILSVFACSAVWHGFYPAYYVTFGSCALLLMAAKQVRHNIRPSFQTTRTGSYLYGVITFIATRLANSYLAFPFLVLEFYACFNVYKSLYFYYHILSIMALLYFKFVKKQEIRSDQGQQSTHNQTTSGQISTFEQPDNEVTDTNVSKSLSIQEMVAEIIQPKESWQSSLVLRMK